MNIGTVVEGPTDRLVIMAIINRLLPGEHRFFPLQPMETFGRTGTGWKGVRRWCRDTWRRPGMELENFLSGSTGPPLDLLVTQLDADVAGAPDLLDDSRPATEIQKPCPPIEDTANGLRDVIHLWLNRDELPESVVPAIPAQDIEHWVFAALFPGDPCCQRKDYECPKPDRESPAHLLSLKRYGKLTTRRSGKIKKSERLYRKSMDRISRNTEDIETICTQGRRFAVEIRSLQINAPEHGQQSPTR
jgi:hypothetical protein